MGDNLIKTQPFLYKNITVILIVHNQILLHYYSTIINKRVKTMSKMFSPGVHLLEYCLIDSL